MSTLPGKKIASYYELFKSIDVTFSKDIIQATGLVPNQVHLKCVGDFWPCVIYSSSFQGAKVVVSIKSGILQKLDRANNMVSLRFCFKTSDKGNPVAFFVNTKSMGYSPYGGSDDVAIFNLQFTQRPPDDLIEIMGRVLDANVNSAKKRGERIIINPDAIRKMSIVSREAALFIQNVPRNCILRDLAFSGAKIIMQGVAKFLVDKKAALRVDFDDPRESFLVEGMLVNAEPVEGHKDLIAITMNYDESAVPLGYKMRINDYLSVIRADGRGDDKGGDEQQAAKASKPAAPAASKPAAAKPAAPASEKPAKAPAEETTTKAAADGGFDPGPPPG